VILSILNTAAAGGADASLPPVSDLTAGGPLIILASGILLLLIGDMINLGGRARAGIFLAALLGAACLLRAGLGQPAAQAFSGTFDSGGLNSIWGLIFLTCTALAWAFGRGYYGREKPFMAEHDCLLLTACLGMLVMAGARDLLVFFIGLETLSVPLYILAAFRRSRNDSVEAGLKYFILGAFAAALFLYGSALVYGATGTVSLTELRAIGLGTPLAAAGVALIAASLFFKTSIFPFHLWAPDVYQGSPAPVTILMATGTKAAAFAFLLHAAFLLPPAAAGVVALLALVTMALGNLGALVQTNVKRMLAYSGVAHAGTVLLALAGALAGDPLNSAGAGAPVQAVLFYMAAYAVSGAGAFGLLSILEGDGDERLELSSLDGLAEKRPFLAAGLTLFLLSLGGIPATGGFLGKYLVFSVLVRADMVGAAVIGVLFSVVALAYYLRVIVAMYMRPRPDELLPPLTRRLSAAIAATLCAAGVIWLGCFPRTLLALLG
jgi:NADH-quinone oxidoreductase subunit N